MITPTRIAAIRARLEAATPGPWEWTGNALDQSENPYQEVISTEVSCGAYCLGGMWAPGIDEDDKALIANAPADLADLLAALDAAQAELTGLHDEHFREMQAVEDALAERDAATARAEQAEAEANALRAEVARRHEGLVAQIQDALVWAHNRGASGAPMIAYRYRAEEAIASADEAIRVVQEGAPHD
jgi:multidrug efflux pump subunit AcrA (membrane-fusion protein)